MHIDEPDVGLRTIIAVHSTALGPSLGGIRFWTYPREGDAFAEGLRLSEAMTLDAAGAGSTRAGSAPTPCWARSVRRGRRRAARPAARGRREGRTGR
ncbi:MAG: Glu/Leu/Phe/Val dehydrogenase dimerization domain-containing protein [Acidimicrobiia bacterium]